VIRKYKLNQLEVEALQFTGSVESADECISFCPEAKLGPGILYIYFFGKLIDSCHISDWLCKDSTGRSYVVSDYDFEKKFGPTW